MAFGKFLIFILPLFFLACAQVGQISGGEKDEIAPRPIPSKTIPPNGSTFFTGNSIEITFDEFIQLNNPQQTMVLIPNHAKLTASISKKTLKIDWKEKLNENTTYVIYLNGTVKDVTENNDSLLSYVFSTGSSLDSLNYSINVVDAWTNKALSGVTVGLFDKTDSVKPYYFSKSNAFGKARFTNLKKGNYQLMAFKDENNDLAIQTNESLAFREEILFLDSSIIDTIPLRVSRPIDIPKITTFKFYSPSSFVVGSNFSIENATYFLNEKQLDPSLIRQINNDSIQFFFHPKDLPEVDLVVKSPYASDTVSLRISEKEKINSIQVMSEFNKNKVGPHESLTFSIHDLISTVDTNNIIIKAENDSLNSIPYKYSFNQNQLLLEFDRKKYPGASICFQKGAIKSAQGIYNDSIIVQVKFACEKEYGSFNVDVAAFDNQIILDVLQNNKIIKSVVLDSDKTVSFPFLHPGDYTFRIISDSNKNGKWDPNHRKDQKQAEKVYWFSTPTKLRANWESDIKLTPEIINE